MRDLSELLADAHAHGEQDPPDPWFLVESLMIAAGESGVKVGAR